MTTTISQHMDNLVSKNERILVTGASGFIGVRLVSTLLKNGFNNIRCLVRGAGNLSRLEELLNETGCEKKVEIHYGNLLSKIDCRDVCKGASVIYHLAAGTGTKAFSDAYLNSVVSTRNLVEAAMTHKDMRRLVNISSFAVYSNRGSRKSRLIDEYSQVEGRPESRAEAYCYGKVKQEELVKEYGERHGLKYVILRPGTVYGPGKKFIPGRVGIDTFGVFLHTGGPNRLPLTYVDNCAEAIMLAGLTKGIDGKVFNIVDDDLPTSRCFLKLYKRHVDNFPSIYLPHGASWMMCLLWEKISEWSNGQLPAVFTRREWSAYWKKTFYSNEKIKASLGWFPRVPTKEGLRLYFEACKESQ